MRRLSVVALSAFAGSSLWEGVIIVWKLTVMFLFGQNHVVYETFSLVVFILLEVVFGFCSHRNFVKLFDLGDFGVVIDLKVETVSCHCDGLVGSPREVILLRCGLGRFAPGNLSFA